MIGRDMCDMTIIRMSTFSEGEGSYGCWLVHRRKIVRGGEDHQALEQLCSLGKVEVNMRRAPSCINPSRVNVDYLLH